ncbi:hypothetical protein BGZ94_001492 [Podila epigama]|nr:hypothetical protein BGZ94_001492 [Podila epigama]
MSEVEETIRRLSSKKNVQGVVVVNQLGLMIRSTLDATLGKQYATLMSDLVRMARDSVAQLDAQTKEMDHTPTVSDPNNLPQQPPLQPSQDDSHLLVDTSSQHQHPEQQQEHHLHHQVTLPSATQEHVHEQQPLEGALQQVSNLNQQMHQQQPAQELQHAQPQLSTTMHTPPPGMHASNNIQIVYDHQRPDMQMQLQQQEYSDQHQSEHYQRQQHEHFEQQQQLALQQQQQQQQQQQVPEHHQHHHQQQQQHELQQQDQHALAHTRVHDQGVPPLVHAQTTPITTTIATPSHSTTQVPHNQPHATYPSNAQPPPLPQPPSPLPSRKATVNGLMERMTSAGSSRRPSSVHSNGSSGAVSPHGSISTGSTSLYSTTQDDAFSNNPEDYDIRLPIGYGSSAVVYNAYYKPTNKRVAIKVIDLDMFERNQIDELRRETQVMALCKHPNVLHVNGAFVSDSKLYIVTPYLSAGSCLDIMKAGHPNGLEEIAIATILKQALQGLDYLHKNGHIHRDVKAGNLLVDNDGSVLLADFGVSSSLMENGDRRGMRKTFVGTPCWMAPEVMEQAGYDYKADIWSFGITAIELATGHAPFAKYPPIKVLMLTLSNDPPTLDRDSTKHRYSKVFKDMIDTCLQKDPSRRPTAEKLLSHPFFKQAKKRPYLVSGLLHGLPPLEQRPPKKPAQKLEIPERGVSWDFDGADSAGTEQEHENAPVRQPRTVTFETPVQQAPLPEQASVEVLHTPTIDTQKAVAFSTDDSPRTDTPTSTAQTGDKPVKKSRFVIEDASTSHAAGSTPVVSSLSEQLASTSMTSTRPPAIGTADQGLQGLGVSPSTPEQGLPEVKKGRFSVKDTSAASSPVPISIKTMPNELMRSPSRSLASSPREGQPEGVRIGNTLEPITPERKSRFEVHHSSTSGPGTPIGPNSPALSAIRSGSIPLSRESSVGRISNDSTLTRDNSVTRVSRFSIESTHSAPSSEPTSTPHSGANSTAGTPPIARGHTSTPVKKSRFQVSTVDGRSASDHGQAEGPSSASSTPNTSPTGSLMRGQHPAILDSLTAQSTVHQHLETLMRQNEQQRAILSELFTGLGVKGGFASSYSSLGAAASAALTTTTGQSTTGHLFSPASTASISTAAPHSGKTQPSLDAGAVSSNNSSVHRQEPSGGLTLLERQLQVTMRENESLRRENEVLKRELERLRRPLHF